jgi:hypothetical protein
MADTLLYEMRAYRVADGRMGEELQRGLDCILAPAAGGLGLFDRYAIPRPVGLWRAMSGPHQPAVIFLYCWQSVAQRANAFETFYVDPAWQALRASTNDGSEIVDCMDDILLRGPAPAALPANAIYEFTRGAPRSGTRTVIGPLMPLCGNDPADLFVGVHENAPALADADGAVDVARILCRRITIGGEA